VVVESLEAIGIYPSKDEVANQVRKQKRVKDGVAQSAPTNPTDNPWDIRNFADRLIGYRIEGDWIKVKCPAHDGTTDDSLHICLETGAYKCWGGCDTRRVYKEALAIAVASGYKLPKKPKPSKPPKSVEEKGEKGEPAEEGEFTQVAIARLYSASQWICFDNKLFEWTGNYYRHSPDEVESQRIQSLSEKISYYSEKAGRTCFPNANPSKVKSALEWAKMKFAILSETINPPGLNCKNGVLRIEWKATSPESRANTPEFTLVPHSPDRRYTYEPLALYDPDADSADCDRLLGALAKDQQEVFMRTTSAAFDIDTVRKFHGRAVRALLCKGIGSNGKDALREAVGLLWGRTGMTSIALEDFAQYDTGRKFPVAPLVTSRINWSSENSRSVSLDNLQSLKRAVTGDPLHQELKGRDHKEFKPRAIHLFNINETPYLKNASEAIKSRYAVISFAKVFKKGADLSRGESEVDPRFKDDNEFVEKNILSALLNRTIASFKSLMAEGIDFTCCDPAMQEIQINQSHLYEFALESGLIYDSDSVMPIVELYSRLEDYYKETKILQVESVGDRVIRNFEDPVRPGDLYIKGQNAVSQRFLSLYPQCQKVPLGKNRFGIKGLAFKPVNRAAEQSTETPADDNDPFEATTPVDSQSEESKHLSPENIDSLVELAQGAIDDGSPETIDIMLESVPPRVRVQAKAMVMLKVRPRVSQLKIG
jgi:putative DNA primase/helicase